VQEKKVKEDVKEQEEELQQQQQDGEGEGEEEGRRRRRRWGLTRLAPLRLETSWGIRLLR
jgi:hypothetical protein